MFIDEAAYAEYCTFFLSAHSCIIHFYATASSPSGFTSLNNSLSFARFFKSVRNGK
jgi:hypothetical protein